jgi:hypothetical protein
MMERAKPHRNVAASTLLIFLPAQETTTKGNNRQAG